jgi:hypothetical protein
MKKILLGLALSLSIAAVAQADTASYHQIHLHLDKAALWPAIPSGRFGDNQKIRIGV